MSVAAESGASSASAGPGDDVILILVEAGMTQSPHASDERPIPATHADVRDVFGALDDDRITAILALRPTIADVEEASVWLSGDADVFGPGRPLKDVAGQIVALLTADEDDDRG